MDYNGCGIYTFDCGSLPRESMCRDRVFAVRVTTMADRIKLSTDCKLGGNRTHDDIVDRQWKRKGILFTISVVNNYRADTAVMEHCQVLYWQFCI